MAKAPMTLVQAAAVYERVQPVLDGMAEDLAQLKVAEEVLKEHFKATGRQSYGRRIGCRLGSREYFHPGAAKELLSSSEIAKCMRTSTTATLFLLAPKPPAGDGGG